MKDSPQHVAKSGRHRPKVKTGCRTCKTRKLKCDEGFPACIRCVSTGRRCPGYGVWGGGGGGDKAEKQADDAIALVKHALAPSYECIAPFSALAKTPQVVPIGASSRELEYFDWLRTYTVYKLPGSCPSGFWNQLLLQASTTEPAVWHAAMAMSSFHKANALRAVQPDPDAPHVLRRAERVALGHYGRSISFLQPHFEAKDRASLRTTLIACIMFLCLELLRGNLEAAEAHLENGLRILAMNQPDGDSTQRSALPSRDGYGQGLIDDQIEETLSRFRVQFDLYQLLRGNTPAVRSLRAPRRIPARFKSLKDAWMALDSLSTRIMALRNSDPRAEPQGSNQHANHELESKRSSLAAALDHWLKIYTLSKPYLAPDSVIGYLRAYTVMLLTYPMLEVLLETALVSQDEMEYDWHNSKFLAMVEHVITLMTMTGEHPGLATFKGTSSASGRSILDVGCIAPLYFTAVKCRVHRIRLQAIRLLEAAGHREGFWDANTAAREARKVMEAEEGDYYDGVKLADDFELTSYPSREDLSLPLIPASRRVHTTLDAMSEGSSENSPETFHVESAWSSHDVELINTL